MCGEDETGQACISGVQLWQEDISCNYFWGFILFLAWNSFRLKRVYRLVIWGTGRQPLRYVFLGLRSTSLFLCPAPSIKDHISKSNRTRGASSTLEKLYAGHKINFKQYFLSFKKISNRLLSTDVKVCPGSVRAVVTLSVTSMTFLTQEMPDPCHRGILTFCTQRSHQHHLLKYQFIFTFNEFKSQGRWTIYHSLSICHEGNTPLKLSIILDSAVDCKLE